MDDDKLIYLFEDLIKDLEVEVRSLDCKADRLRRKIKGLKEALITLKEGCI